MLLCLSCVRYKSLSFKRGEREKRKKTYTVLHQRISFQARLRFSPPEGKADWEGNLQCRSLSSSNNRNHPHWITAGLLTAKFKWAFFCSFSLLWMTKKLYIITPSSPDISFSWFPTVSPLFSHSFSAVAISNSHNPSVDFLICKMEIKLSARRILVRNNWANLCKWTLQTLRWLYYFDVIICVIKAIKCFPRVSTGSLLMFCNKELTILKNGCWWS